MDAVLRRPESSDARAMAVMHTEAWRATYGGSVPHSYLDESAIARRVRHWQTVMDSSTIGQNVAVAELDSIIIGVAHCGIEDGVRKLFALYVLDDYHGTGIGQRLFDAVVTDESTELWVAQDNHRAVSFYLRNGFRPDGSAQDFPGVEGFVTIRMVR